LAIHFRAVKIHRPVLQAHVGTAAVVSKVGVSVSMLWCPRTFCPPTLRCRTTTSVHPVATRQDTMPRDTYGECEKLFEKKSALPKKRGIPHTRTRLSCTELIARLRDCEAAFAALDYLILVGQPVRSQKDEGTEEKIRHNQGDEFKESATR
jgi:hypothetical protein